MATKKAAPKNQEVKEPKLTDKQELFVRHYLVSLNATHAARMAGYQGDSVTLASVGYENLRKPQISERISNALNEKAMPPGEVIARLEQQARGDHSAFWECDEYGRQMWLNMKELTEAGLGHLVKRFQCHELTGQITSVEFYDAQAALKLIGTHYKLFNEKTEVSGTIKHEHSGTITFDEARKLPINELAGRIRGALGELAETKRRW